MDTSINLNRLARKLYRRATHRLLGNPFLGSFSAFLTLLLLIRIAANFYMVVRLSNTNPNIDAVQIASAHFVFLSAYAVWVGTLGSCRIALALPRYCSIDFALHARRFRSMFLRRVVLFRPMTVAYLSIMLLTALISSAICGSWGSIFCRYLIVLLSTFAAVIVVTALSSRSFPSRSELQILETLYLLFLLVLNPDIGSSKGVIRISFLSGSLRYSFSNLWQVGSAVGVIFILALLVLFLLRGLTGVSKLFRRQISFSPMERWYWRFLRIRSWVILYVIVTPIFISSAVSQSTKRWTLVLSILFAVASYLYFISHCENTLHEKWRCSLFDRGNSRLLARTILNHAALMGIPVLGYIVFR
jgi:hypothetical protein